MVCIEVDIIAGGDDGLDPVLSGLGLEAGIDECAESGHSGIRGCIVGIDVELRGAVEHGYVSVGCDLGDG